MKPLRKRAMALISLCLTCLPLPSFSQDRAERSPRIEVEELGPGLAIVRIAGISATVSRGADGVLVVDPGLEEAAPFLEREITKLGGGKVTTIIDTHWHFDHAGGNKAFGPDAVIISSEPTQEWLSRDQMLLGTKQPAYPPSARPGVVAAPTRSVSGFPGEVTVSAMPGGHTGGDVIVHFPRAKVLAIGDIVFAGQFPFVDIDHGGSVVKLAEVLQQIIEGYPEGTRIVPGHGPVLSLEDLKTYRRMVLETTDVVRRAMAAGRSLEQIRTDAVLAAWKDWDGSFRQDDWIGFIHASLEPDAADPDPLAGLKDEAEALDPLTGSAWVKRWLAAVSTLPSPEPRTVFREKAARAYYSPEEAGRLPQEKRGALEQLDLPASYFYYTRYGTPLAYARALDLVATNGFEQARGARILDFGCGGIGQLRLLAALGAEAVGVDVDSSLRALYREPEDVGRVDGLDGSPGSVSLVIGRFPAEEEARRAVGSGYDLIVSKNTLKNGYLHPERPVDERMLVDLGVDDEEFLRTLYSILKPGGRFLIYNLAPAPAPPDQPYKPWADGRSPFSRGMLETAGFRVIAFDVDDTPAARTMGRALGWDRGDSPMDLDNDLFATWTLVQK